MVKTYLRYLTVFGILLSMMSMMVGQVGATTDADEPELCFFLGGDVQVVARSQADLLNGLVNCHTVDEAGVGNLEVIMQGVVRAVDVFGEFNSAVDVCLLGSGNLIFLDAVNAPRIPQPIGSNFGGGYTCTVITTEGTVVLVNNNAGLTIASTPSTDSTSTDTTATANASTTSTVTTTTTTTTVTTTTSSSDSDNSIVHTVRAGENLFRIGLRYGVSYQQIAADNGIGTDWTIYVGQRLVINLPAST
ncbi:MAG: LysM domain-containing protein [Chloroflexota bacterium]